MGISGLLQALKSIQVTRHLEEYSGKTVAVDAYGWLHKGLYSCATDLATGRPSHKYVDYAMHRVRLLRHYGIHPYIVFDGGPLPAKKGTESERKKKREENILKGKALTAQGKHTQARECYIKSVDVTPQMAFQFIKALKADAIPYVVAPYEADSQMAYLERAGIVDAILTEDSDLLVFGCKNVLYKLDVVANTVVSISREDFGAVMATATEPTSISLSGWNDTQFRSMAILSGCDYLPSIPGIGLKTANNLLRKWRTPEQVIKAIALEGKKSVPIGYWKEFQKAEKCFLHQRVYCPLQQKLVNLTEVSGEWNEAWDAYVGSDIEQALARSIAEGEACPISYEPMVDINPGFVPRGLKKPIPAVAVSPRKSAKGKGKARETIPSGGILSFFGPKPIIPPHKKNTQQMSVSAPVKPNMSGKASGKRTLADTMEQDMQRRKKHKRSPSPLKEVQPKQSRFFGSGDIKSTTIQRRHSEGGTKRSMSRDSPALVGPSGLRHGYNKENVRLVHCVPRSGDDDDEAVCTSEPELDGSDMSMRGQADHFEGTMRMELDIEQFPEAVEQEDGYVSPTPSCSKDFCDLSSPIRARMGSPKGNHTPMDLEDEEAMGMTLSEDDERVDDAEHISSPISVRKPKSFTWKKPRQSQGTPTRRKSGTAQRDGGVFEGEDAPTPTKCAAEGDADEVPSPTLFRGPDLRSLLGVDVPTELGVEADDRPPSLTRSGSASPPSPSPDTPLGGDSSRNASPLIWMDTSIVVDLLDGTFDEEDLEEQRRALEAASRAKAVRDGWRAKWALASSKSTPLQQKRGMQAPSASKLGKTSSPKRSRLNGVLSSNKKDHVALLDDTQPATRMANLKRCETNVTPLGRHSLASLYQPPKSAPSKVAGCQTSKSSASTLADRLTLFQNPRAPGFGRTSGSASKELVDLTIEEF